MTDSSAAGRPIGIVVRSVLFVTAIFLCNFTTRVVLAPLMPVMQADLGFSHAGAGHLFLALAVGNAIGLLLSGFLSRVAYHRRTVGISAICVGVAALAVPLASDYAELFAGVVGLGVSVGLYLPSGIAVITSLVRKEDWGKALSLHEVAPNLSYVFAPILAEAVLLLFDWRVGLGVLGVVQLVMGVWFLRKGRGGEFPGTVPVPSLVRSIVTRPVFWLLVLLFSMAVGASMGPYSMLPLYLVDSHGYTRAEANQLLAVSRVLACFAPFVAGWMTDRWGIRPVIFLYLFCTGCSLVTLGLASGKLLVAMTLVQPVFSVLLFPAGFTLLSSVFDPAERSVAVALMGPCNALIGIGLFPTFLGHMGDAGLFGPGFVIQGALLLIALAVLPSLPRVGGRENG